LSRVLAKFLLIVAVLVQCSPLRTCEWSTLLSGRSCHDLKVASVGADTGLRTAEVGSHDAGPVTGDENTCVCNTPKGIENHGGAAHIGPDFAPFVAGPVLVCIPPSFPGIASVGGNDAPPSGPNPPQRTPLLI
jgi:hypothetical protein